MNLNEAEKIVRKMDDDPLRGEAYQLILANAEDYIHFSIPESNLLSDEERGCVADAVCNNEDPMDALEEWRFWRSPFGRRVEAYESFESGRF